MNRLQFPNYEALSNAAAEHIFQLVCENPRASICLATGSTPTGTYKSLQNFGSARGPSKSKFSQTTIVKLDEWGGLEDLHPATCEYYLREYVIQPLEIEAQRYISFRASAADPQAECQRVKTRLANEVSRLDLCVLGLGINGHLGFNEPASALTAHTHIATLTEQTQQHPMVKGNETKPTYGFTLGMADLLQAKEIMLLVSGDHKRQQLIRLLDNSIDTQFPASFLCLHPDVTLYTDI
jgi:galactosamine-6-phosphate isomerase